MMSGGHWHSEHGLAVLYPGRPHNGTHPQMDDIAGILEDQLRTGEFTFLPRSSAEVIHAQGRFSLKDRYGWFGPFGVRRGAILVPDDAHDLHYD